MQSSAILKKGATIKQCLSSVCAMHAHCTECRNVQVIT